MPILHRTVFIAIAWLTSGLLFAQPAQYKFSRINLDQGLSHNQINAIFKDSRGYLWFGTTSGLNRYDGYSFKSFRHDARDTTSLSNNYIEAIFEGPEGKLWVSTRGALNVYDPRTGRFHQDPSPFLRQLSLPNLAVTNILRNRKGDYWFLDPNKGLFRYSAAGKGAEKVPHRPTDSLTVRSAHISALAEDPKGNIWVIHRNGILEKLNSSTLQVTYRSSAISQKFRGELLDYRLFIDRDGSLWVLPGADARGLLYFDPAQNHLLHIHQDAEKARLNNNLVRDVVQDDRGLIWIATDHGGINLLDKKDFSVQYLLHHPDDEKSISQNSINSLYKDNTGIVWVGTIKKGISYYHENIIKFPLVKNQSANPHSLPYDDINRFVEDAKGNLWIGTNGGGLLYYDRASGRYTQFLHDPNDPNSVSSNVIVSLHLDHEQKLWIGTYFGGLSVYDGSTFTHYKHDPAHPKSLPDNRVWAIFEDSRQSL
ncbi:hypothetical protein BH24BAC1_BH24BAC1_25950 [soil metagenome]